MITYEPLAGEHISRAIEKLCKLANTGGDTARGTFNGVDLVATPGVDPAAVEQQYRDLVDAQAAAYQASTEGRAAARKRAEQIEERQTAVDELAAEMRVTLNAEDVPAILRWFKRLADVADDISVSVPTVEILGWFTSRGYEANVNCGDNFDADDRENVARWIIGQALSTLATVGAPHSIVHKFADEWLAGRSPAG